MVDEEIALQDEDIEVFAPESPTTPGTRAPGFLATAAATLAGGRGATPPALPCLYADDADDDVPQDRSTVARQNIAELARLSNMNAVPRRVLDEAAVLGLPIDPRAAFLLAQIDGATRLEHILDTCALTEGDALVLLRHLIELGIITLPSRDTTSP